MAGIDDAAAKPNPRLQKLSVLVGTWTTVGTHPLEIDEPEIPTAIALFGTDDASGSCSMLYFDERGVSRRYEVRLEDNEWRWWRDAPDFSQRFVGTITPDGRTIVGRGEYSRNGGAWEPDLALKYSRVD